jgi:hypothetical protein
MSDTKENRSGMYNIGAARWPGLSKLLEEAGEVLQVGGKIMGNHGEVRHWDGSHLPTRMEEELGDLLAAIGFFVVHNPLNPTLINMRYKAKLAKFEEWHRAGDPPPEQG